jgi:Phage integrase family
MVGHTLERAGIGASRKGAHQFRHALACQMLRQGASLSEIGELLGHRSPQTTAIREGGSGLARDVGAALARRRTVTSWRKAVEDYLDLRRSLGFKLLEAKVGLISFASFLKQRRAEPSPLRWRWNGHSRTRLRALRNGQGGSPSSAARSPHVHTEHLRNQLGRPFVSFGTKAIRNPWRYEIQQ